MTGSEAELQAIRRVADAVLYEGYLLYPYRASSAKNQVRWQFGVLGPVGAAEAGVGEEPALYTECLLDGAANASLDVHLRYLHTQWRAVERAGEQAGSFHPVATLSAGDGQWLSWHEAVEQEHLFAGLPLPPPGEPHAIDLTVPATEEIELLREADHRLVGRLVRTRWPLAARLEVSTAPVDGRSSARVVRISVTNTTNWPAGQDRATPDQPTGRDLAARRSLVGTHLILQAHGGKFVSTVDPPSWAVATARGCGNSRCWPVLAGVEDSAGAQTSAVVLAAPIILYDHPAIAAESPGDLFDATEIDEILTLRVMTLTDDEKQAARATDPRAAAIIDRCDEMPPEVFDRLHGALRGYGLTAPATALGPAPAPARVPLVGAEPVSFDTAGAPWWDPAEDAAVSPESDAVFVGDVRVAKGTRVMLRPSRRADAQDLFLAGMTATVHAVLADVDGGSHVAVTLEDDPASELHEWYGRYYYFAPDELEPLPVGAP